MIRYLEQSEKQNIRTIYEQSFEEPREYTEYYFENRLPGAHVAVSEENNEILSTMQMIPKTVIVGNFKSTILYICGVCTSILHRNQGLMKNMFAQVLNDMFADMEPFTYLIPSDMGNAEIYKKYGFEYVMDKQNTKPEEQRKKPTHSLMSRRADNSDLVRLSIFSQAYTEKKFDITLCRDVDYFRKIKELIEVEGGYIEIFIENKVIVGYRIWIDDEVLEEVLDDSVSATMSWLDTEKKPYAMARILNVRNTMRRLRTTGIGQNIIYLSDPVIKENNGYFMISYERGSVHFEKVDKKDVDMEVKIDVSIGELTAHIFGYKLIDGLPKVCTNGGFFINDYI